MKQNIIGNKNIMNEIFQSHSFSGTNGSRKYSQKAALPGMFSSLIKGFFSGAQRINLVFAQNIKNIAVRVCLMDIPYSERIQFIQSKSMLTLDIIFLRWIETQMDWTEQARSFLLE